MWDIKLCFHCATMNTSVKFCKWDHDNCGTHLQNYLIWFWPLSLSTPFTPTNLSWPPLTPALPSLCPTVSGSSQHLNAVTSALISGVVVLGVMSLGLFILSLRLLRKHSPSSLTGAWNPSFRWPWRPNPERTETRQTIFGHCFRMSQNCNWATLSNEFSLLNLYESNSVF